ncbi:GNAT family N-acetyltransferase [Deinococcus sp. MIMF12]|uniref:GNAT family N-acetyltransferase n=1 Tax=Deinococcus rhizophilus TaxID=3049544 RepID=A0ABT7JHC3_9DEIO|nr:GNAT family N-acetyltransferase [Deinococcus rhizophilus]MDL2344457.1 GNAT family N-acetyltransferase [Deinococcus rhizophilus]
MTPPGLSLRVRHTAFLPGSTRAALRELLNAVYGDSFSDDDWDHALGGLHTLARLEGQLVGHAAVVQRAFLVGDAPRRVGYLEAMGVHPAVQRRGIGRAMLRRVNLQVTRAYDLGALSASDEGLGLYRAGGWAVWRGPLGVMTPGGVVPTPEEAGGVLVYAPAGELHPHLPLTCDFRSGDVW